MEQLYTEFAKYEYPMGTGVLRKIKVIKNWDSPQFREFLVNFEKYFGQCHAFHDYRNVLVRIGQNETLGMKKEIVAKKFGLVRSYDHFRFHFLPSKALRSLNIALVLLKNGLKTPHPVAIIEDRGRLNRLVNCYYLTEFLEYDYSFTQIANEFDDNVKGKIISEAAQNICVMHNAGIIHNDLHVSNILVKNAKTQPEFYYIDLNRARGKKALSIKARAKDLGRLSLKQSDQMVFLKNYNPVSYQDFSNLVNKMQRRRKMWIELKKGFREIKGQLWRKKQK